MSTNLIYHCIQKFQPGKFTGGLFEGEVIIYCLCVGGQVFSEAREIFWRVLGSLFMVKHIG